MNDLRKILRTVVKRIEDRDVSTALHDVEFVRVALKERGLEANCHVGQSKDFLSDVEHAVEWYAGQLLDIVDNRLWYAMNSYVNCLDKFCPAEDETEG